MEAIISERKAGTIRGEWRGKELVSSFKVYNRAEQKMTYQPHPVVDCRVYRGRSVRASDVYCLIWTYDENMGKWRDGAGRASGGGYDMESHAIGQAIADAGFDLSERIHGVGRSAIVAGLLAVAGALVKPGECDLILSVSEA